MEIATRCNPLPIGTIIQAGHGVRVEVVRHLDGDEGGDLYPFGPGRTTLGWIVNAAARGVSVRVTAASPRHARAYARRAAKKFA
jgi:hypothetical protein